MKPPLICPLVVLWLLHVASFASEPWKRHTIDNTSRGADGVRLADFNGDGRPDIATGWEEGGVVRLYLHPPPAEVKKPWPHVTVGKVKSPEDAVPVDLDGDGAMDIVSSCEGKTRQVFIHWAPADRKQLLDSAAWKTDAFPNTAGTLWMFALPLDVDGERGIDLVVGSKGGDAGAINALLSPKDPRRLADWQLVKRDERGWIMSMQTSDVDRDGDQDVLISNRRSPDRGVFWLENPGVAQRKAQSSFDQWRRHAIGGADRQVMFLSAGDVDGDGRRDVASAVSGGDILLLKQPNDTKGEPWQVSEIKLPTDIGTGKGTAIGDIDLDGMADVVFSCENASGSKSGVRWLSRSKSPQRWDDHEISGPEGVKFDRLELLDIDADGDLDVLTCEERAGLGVIWYENPAK